MSEAELQSQVCAFLNVGLSPRVFWFHPVNEGKRGWRAQRDFKRFGGRAGLPDVMICADGRAYGLELKFDKGAVSAAQKGCHMDLAIAGVPTAVCRSLEDVVLALKQWGIPMRATLRSAAP